MKVRLFRSDTIVLFAMKHANWKRHFNHFLTAIHYADWNEPADITRTIKGNLLGNGSNRVVFDIGGNGPNAFRIICEYKFGMYYKKSNAFKVHLYVNWIGTHESYNHLNKMEKLNIDEL